MYIKDSIDENTKIYFTQEDMNKGSRMFVLENENNVFEFYATIEEARKLANDLMYSIEKFEAKYGG